jgi:hypothetical protein
MDPTPSTHSCKVDDPSCCASCRSSKLYRRLRQNQQLDVPRAGRIALGAYTDLSDYGIRR